MAKRYCQSLWKYLRLTILMAFLISLFQKDWGESVADFMAGYHAG